MKAHIKHIGIITNDDKIHSVKFEEGVNIITGRSSTGKSAILEVFDYCFGSSEFIIPEGVITKNAKLYFTVLNISDSFIVLARGVNEKRCYISFITDNNFVNDVKNFDIYYFNSLEVYTLHDFKKELNRYFRIDIEDTDTDIEDRTFRMYNAKKEAPSFRHFTSFMLQHQNLIANKHALFYRFDEKEKKDQVIEQFKIFLSFVDANYFPLKQELADINRLLKTKEFQKEKALKIQETLKEDLQYVLEDYQLITNKKLFDHNIVTILSNPDKYINLLNSSEGFKIESVDNSDSNIKKRTDLQTKYNSYLVEIRKIQNIISEIDLSIIYADEFNNQTSNLSHVNNTELNSNECKFCGNENIKLADKQKKLVEALKWFNSEMEKSSYTIESFTSNKKEYERKLIELKKEANSIKSEINKLDNIITDLEKNKSIEYQATKSIIKVEAFLETLQKNNLHEIQEEIDKIKERKEEIESELFDNYNVESKLKLAARQISQQMNIIGKELEFEKMYKDALNLKFDINTFELYQQMKKNGKDDKKIYLRSMGSGANWLSSHISLFTGLLYYFCSLKEKCLIPTILFLDQPSQVYFPTEIDNAIEFDGKNLKKLTNKNNGESDDEYSQDINAVTNLFDQLVKFCNDTLTQTGIKPQIIITDHADNLKLKNAKFEDLVRARWRNENEGFIKLK
jgi:YHS domain-containing protein/uncharacterized protein YfcZ (UPF0381/DUF406 family)